MKLQNAGFFGLNHSGDLSRASELLLKHQNLGGLQIDLLVECLQVGLELLYKLVFAILVVELFGQPEDCVFEVLDL